MVIRGGVPQELRAEPNTVAQSKALLENPRARVFVIFLDTNHVEVDGSHNRISLSSPLGRALIGKSRDDDIEVQTPKGKRAYLLRKLVTIHELITAENGK